MRPGAKGGQEGMVTPKSSAALLGRLRRRCPPALKTRFRRRQAWARRHVVRVLAADERAESRDLEARGLLGLDAAAAAVLDRPLAPSELYEIDRTTSTAPAMSPSGSGC